MKQLLLLPAFMLAIGFVCRAQETEQTAVRTEVPDSLTNMYKTIDQLSEFDLPKWRESYIYKCRKEPSEYNKAILAYIEKRMGRKP